MNVETERTLPADVSDDNKDTIVDAEPGHDRRDNTRIFDSHNQDMTDCLAEPKRNNIRRISDELKVTASGALETGRDGIKKAASGLSSGIRTVTNRIPLPKSPKAFRRRSWHAYDELEEHIVEQDSVSDDEARDFRKVRDKKDKFFEGSKEKTKKDKDESSKEKSKKDKRKGKKNGKKGLKTEEKIDWCSGNGSEDEKKCETEVRNEMDATEEEAAVVFESLESTELMSKVSITVHEAN